MLEWLKQNMPLITALGEIGQFLAAIFAAIAAGLSWRAVRVAKEEAVLAREEAERNRRSFQFSWEPLLEVTFDVKAEIERNQQLVLPSTRYEEKYKSLSQEAKTMVHEFVSWREQYGLADQSQESPHPDSNYLVVIVHNLQSNLVGQAVDVDLLIEFVYADPEQGLQNIMSSDSKLRTIRLPFRLDRIGPSQKAVAWLAHIANVPGLRVTVRAIECKTWGEVVVIRGIGGAIDLSGSQAISTAALVSLARDEGVLRDGTLPIALYPVIFQKANQEESNGRGGSM